MATFTPEHGKIPIPKRGIRACFGNYSPWDSSELESRVTSSPLPRRCHQLKFTRQPACSNLHSFLEVFLLLPCRQALDVVLWVEIGANWVLRKVL